MRKLLNKKGFTIVELVIVIAVIGILAAVLIPTFASVTNNAEKSAAMQEAKSGLSAILPLTNGTMTNDTLFFVNADDDAEAEFKFKYYGNKLSDAAEDVKLPVYAKAEYAKADKEEVVTGETFIDEVTDVAVYTVFVSAKSVDGNKMLSADYNFLAEVIGFDPSDSEEPVNKADEDDDYYTLSVADTDANGDKVIKQIHIYYTTDFNESLIVVMAPTTEVTFTETKLVDGTDFGVTAP